MERTFNIGLTVPRRSVYSATALMVLAAFSFWQFVGFVIPEAVEIFTVQRAQPFMEFSRLMWVPIIGYLLLAGNILLAAEIFKPLKTLEEGGLAGNLLAVILYGIVFGVVAGFVWHFTLGLIIPGFVGGFAVIFAVSLVVCLIAGFYKELK